jgi:hypothetical protein
LNTYATTHETEATVPNIVIKAMVKSLILFPFLISLFLSQISRVL